MHVHLGGRTGPAAPLEILRENKTNVDFLRKFTRIARSSLLKFPNQPYLHLKFA